MVLIVVTAGALVQKDFVYECTRETSVDTLSTDLGRLWNLQQRISRLATGMKNMATHGVARPNDLKGLSLSQIQELKRGDILGPVEDVMGRRCGNPPVKEAAATLVRTADEALATFDPRKARLRTPLDEKEMLAAIELCRGAVVIAYPGGIPEYDEVSMAITDSEELGGTQDSKFVLDPATCVVWFANKMMAREQKVGKFISMENAICKVKIQARGQGAPSREVDTEARQKMMSMWHAKQKEAEELAEDDENDYMNSAWANPKAYKARMHGLGNVRFR